MNRISHPNRDAWHSIGVYDLGLHLLYASLLIQVSSSGLVFRTAEVLAALGACVFVTGSVLTIPRRWANISLPLSVRLAAFVMPLAVLMLLLNTALDPNPLYRKPMNFFPYFWVIIALGGVDELEWTRLKRTFRIHALVGTAVFAVVVMRGSVWEYSNRSTFLEVSGKVAGRIGAESPLLLSRQLMYTYVIMLVLLPEEKWFWRWVGGAQLLAMTIWSILGQYRSTLVLGVGLAIMFAIYAWQRSRAVGWTQRLIAVAIVAALIGGGWLFVTQARSKRADTMNTAFTQLIARFTSQSKKTVWERSLEDERFTDAVFYLKHLTLFHAFAGEQGGWVGPSDIVMHVGYLRYIIWGGLPTLVAVCLLVYWQGWCGLLTSRRLSVLAAASVAAQHSIQAIPTGMLTVVPQAATLFICAGYCWYRMAADRRSRGMYPAMDGLLRSYPAPSGPPAGAGEGVRKPATRRTSMG